MMPTMVDGAAPSRSRCSKGGKFESHPNGFQASNLVCSSGDLSDARQVSMALSFKSKLNQSSGTLPALVPFIYASNCSQYLLIV